VDLAEALRTFVVVFPAELPDKTMVASVVLVVRFRRPLAVWLGAAAAFAIHVTVAVLAGQILSTLPTRVVAMAVATLFATGAVLMYRQRDEPPGTEALDHGLTPAGPTPWWRVSAVAFSVVLVAEWGDLTQLLTAGLAASSDAPVMVWLGALLALWSVAGLAAALGRTLAARVPVRTLRTVATVVLVTLAVLSLVEAVRS
jgi:Ca2+/H+ antiporter, TMEM165/GDT1 family